MKEEQKPAVEQSTDTPAVTSTERVDLDAPLRRGDQTIARIDIRKPLAGALRGVTLVDVINLDVLALTKVLPRISEPALTDAEIRTMDPADLVQLGTAVAGFLVPKSAKGG